jgi:hypothetical protein
MLGKGQAAQSENSVISIGYTSAPPGGRQKTIFKWLKIINLRQPLALNLSLLLNLARIVPQLNLWRPEGDKQQPLLFPGKSAGKPCPYRNRIMVNGQ